MHAIVYLVLTWIIYIHVKYVYMYSRRKNNSWFLKIKSSQVYKRLILNTVLLPEWSRSVFFCLVIVFHESQQWDSWNLGTRLKLLQKIQTLTDAPEGKTMH